MNTVTTLNKGDELLHFTYRQGEYRIVVKGEREAEFTLIARFSNEDMELVKTSSNKLVLIQNEVSDLQHAVSVEYTLFNKPENKITFEFKNVSRTFSFSPEEWEMVLALQWDPTSEKVA